MGNSQPVKRVDPIAGGGGAGQQQQQRQQAQGQHHGGHRGGHQHPQHQAAYLTAAGIARSQGAPNLKKRLKKRHGAPNLKKRLKKRLAAAAFKEVVTAQQKQIEESTQKQINALTQENKELKRKLQTSFDRIMGSMDENTQKTHTTIATLHSQQEAQRLSLEAKQDQMEANLGAKLDRLLAPLVQSPERKKRKKSKVKPSPPPPLERKNSDGKTVLHSPSGKGSDIEASGDCKSSSARVREEDQVDNDKVSLRKALNDLYVYVHRPKDPLKLDLKTEVCMLFSTGWHICSVLESIDMSPHQKLTYFIKCDDNSTWLVDLHDPDMYLSEANFSRLAKSSDRESEISVKDGMWCVVRLPSGVKNKPESAAGSTHTANDPSQGIPSRTRLRNRMRMRTHPHGQFQPSC